MLLTAPMVSRPKTIWEMNKEELLREAAARNLPINPRWLVGEIRSVINEHRQSFESEKGQTSMPRGLHKMSLEELRETASKVGLSLPVKATKGLIMRLIRDNAEGASGMILSFGRYRGHRFSEVPADYQRWAIRETEANDNASEDLKLFANWARENLAEPTKSYYMTRPDPEGCASIPYTPGEASSWDLLPTVKSKARPTPRATLADPRNDQGAVRDVIGQLRPQQHAARAGQGGCGRDPPPGDTPGDFAGPPRTSSARSTRGALTSFSNGIRDDSDDKNDGVYGNDDQYTDKEDKGEARYQKDHVGNDDQYPDKEDNGEARYQKDDDPDDRVSNKSDGVYGNHDQHYYKGDDDNKNGGAYGNDDHYLDKEEACHQNDDIPDDRFNDKNEARYQKDDIPDDRVNNKSDGIYGNYDQHYYKGDHDDKNGGAYGNEEDKGEARYQKDDIGNDDQFPYQKDDIPDDRVNNKTDGVYGNYDQHYYKGDHDDKNGSAYGNEEDKGEARYQKDDIGNDDQYPDKEDNGEARYQKDDVPDDRVSNKSDGVYGNHDQHYYKGDHDNKNGGAYGNDDHYLDKEETCHQNDDIPDDRFNDKNDGVYGNDGQYHYDDESHYQDDRHYWHNGFAYDREQVYKRNPVPQGSRDPQKSPDERYDSGKHLELFVTDQLRGEPQRWNFSRTSKPFFIEIYAGKGNLSRAMERLGYDVLTVDRPDWDLDQASQRDKLLGMIKNLKPEAVWIAPECRLWSTMQNLNVKSQKQADLLDDARQRHHRQHLAFTEQVFREQFHGGRVAGIEHPSGSLAWHTRALKGLPGYNVVLDQCTYGTKLPDNDGNLQHVRKRTRLQLTHRAAAALLQQTCDGSHDHLQLIGSTHGGGQLTKAAAAYQEGLAQGFAEALDRGVRQQSRDDAVTVGTIDTPAERPKKSQRKQLWKNARRASALAAWTMAVAASYLAETQPALRGPAHSCIFELGGDRVTSELYERGYYTTEPLQPVDVNYLNHETIAGTIIEVKPQVLWIHAEPLGDYLPRLRDAVEIQLRAGRGVVLEAPDCHHLWTSKMGAELAKAPDAEVRREQGHLLLRVNMSQVLTEDDPLVEEADGCPKLNLVADHHGRGPGRGGGDQLPRGSTAIRFVDGDSVKPEVANSLKRLHQNLGHISATDMARHLRLAGAGNEVVAAAKKLRCEVCERNRRGNCPRPSAAPSLVDFNQIVGVDIFSVVDSQGVRFEMMSVLDIGTGFHLVGLLQGHSELKMEQTFCEIWSNTFGPPGTLALDLETGLQKSFMRYCEWHGSKVRRAAGQAHWQQGAVERHGRLWKEIFVRVTDENSVTKEDLPMAITAVNQAINSLRRSAGFSPAQAVWGRDPGLPGELLGDGDPEHFDFLISKDRQRAREHAIRIAARTAYFRCQSDSRLRRALLQRSRVVPEELATGDQVYFYRKPHNTKNWSWFGPAVVIGKEGGNLWISHNGRCCLTAPEHIRRATGEEIGAAFATRLTQDDLNKLLEFDPDDFENYEDNTGGDPAPELHDEDGDTGMEEVEEGAPGPSTVRQEGDGPPPPDDQGSHQFRQGEVPGPSRVRREGDAVQEGRRLRRKTKPAGEEVMMIRKAKTPRGREKQLEKELPWGMIPEEKKDEFRRAGQTQWDEHVKYDALEPVGIEESRKILETKRSRVLNSRFAYKDKLWSRRRQDPTVGWKPKARLVIGGHMDPDLISGLNTNAPTVSRQGVLAVLQILASRLDQGWCACAGDITAAFLNGEELERELYIRQPKSGLGNLHPEQLVKLKKWVFGLADSPHQWRRKFRGSVTDLDVANRNGEKYAISQCPLDPCIFTFQKRLTSGDGAKDLGPPEAYLAVHVDDVLIVGHGDLVENIKEALSATFPITDWERNHFEYIGSYIDVSYDEVKINQSAYVETRLFQVDVPSYMKDEDPATEEQCHDNRSLVGGLSWLASQTRPDLQAGVSMCQQLQKDPTAGDIRFTNLMARRAQEHKDNGVYLRPVNLDKAVLLCYHDAGWANAPQDPDDPFYQLDDVDEAKGRFAEGPFVLKERKCKRNNSRIASQFGALYMLADQDVLTGTASKGSILDWKSGACNRVCRSTFSAESMACSNAVLRRFFETLLTGQLQRTPGGRFQVRLLSDCRSLYDHLVKEGIPRIPTDRRLAIDLAAIREDLKSLGRFAWVPTQSQLADVLTKPMKATAWWNLILEPLRLTFREKAEKEGRIFDQCKSVRCHDSVPGHP